jgi:hypothetical protein
MHDALGACPGISLVFLQKHEHKKGGGWAKTQYKRLNLTKKTPKGHRASFIDLQVKYHCKSFTHFFRA